MQYPNMITIEQSFPRESLEDVGREVRKILDNSGLERKIKPGARVAVTAGSRGISNIVLIIKETVQYLRELGTNPFVLAAMGSHGGGTIQGQLEVLSQLGITEKNIGVPVFATEETIITGEFNGIPVHINRLAFESDALIVINRVKPHTSFHGPNESGLIKMLAVGLGGPPGAAAIHAGGAPALPKVIPGIAGIMQKHLPVVLGLAIIEDAYEETKKIAAVSPENMAAQENSLLKEAYASMPRLPLNKVDLLIVEEMGKCYSGTGMDTNIIGRLRIQGLPEPATPEIKRIVVLDLAKASHGNAHGLGLADFTTRKLVDKIDFKATYLNALTSTFVQRAMIPITLPTEKAAIETALKSLGPINPTKKRIIRMHNTLHLTQLQVSEALMEEVSGSPLCKITGSPEPLKFDLEENLIPFNINNNKKR